MEKINIENLDKRGIKFTLEDRILFELFKEKSLTIYEMSQIVGKDKYAKVGREFIKMANKGYVVERVFNSIGYFYLTSEGVNETEYRFNRANYYKLINLLTSKEYDGDKVRRFYRNRFYQFYIVGEWRDDNLEEQYLEWCESNDISPKSEFRRIL